MVKSGYEKGAMDAMHSSPGPIKVPNDTKKKKFLTLKKCRASEIMTCN